LGVNDEEALIFWDVKPGSHVAEGTVIAHLETTKAVTELTANSSGYLHPLVVHGKPARFGQAIAILHERADVDQGELAALAGQVPSSESAPTGSPRWTTKARLLAEAKGIPMSAVKPAGDVIRESDVLAYLAKAPGGAPSTTSTGVEPAGRRRDLVDDVYPKHRPQRVLVIGGGYGAVQVLDAMHRQGSLRAVGVVDDKRDLAGSLLMGIPVVGTVDQAVSLFEQDAYDAAVISVSTSREFRRRIFNDFRARGIPFVNVVDPSATIHANASLGDGNVILAHCMIGACATIGDNNFLSAYVSLEHHSELGSHCTFGPGVVTSALVKIGDAIKFGTGIFIEPSVTIGDEAVIGSGAILVAPVPARTIVRTRVTSSTEPLP
jgi:sugar O-acyltransferase (sialic acid O-acetyltransferase NeuD family)